MSTPLVPATITEMANELATVEITTELIQSEGFDKQYEAVDAIIKQMTDLKKDLDEKIKKVLMDQYFATGEASIISDGYRRTLVPGTMRETFDSKALKAADPETYKKYVKTSSVAESVRTTKVVVKESTPLLEEK